MKIRLNLDSIGYSEKPEEYYGLIRTRLYTPDRIVEIDPADLAREAERGKTFTVSVMEGKTRDGWQEQQALAIDIDNAAEDFTGDNFAPLKPEDALQILARYDLAPYFMYYTFSSTPDRPRYRMIFVLDRVVAGLATAMDLGERLVQIINSERPGSADTGSSQPDRMYAGSRKGSVFYLEDNITPVERLKELPAVKRTEPEKKEYRPPERIHGGRLEELEEKIENAINTFNMAGYIETYTGSKLIKRGSKTFFNPCPICGHNGCFNVTGSLYSCFSTSHPGSTPEKPAGGNIITFLQEEKGLDYGAARDYFKFDIMGGDPEEWKQAFIEEKRAEEDMIFNNAGSWLRERAQAISEERKERYKEIAENMGQPATDPEPISAEEWAEKGYYAAEITADPGKADKAKKITAIGYEEYRRSIDSVEAPWKITKQHFLLDADYFSGLLTYEAAINAFQEANEEHIELKSFPAFSQAAKIRQHDSVVLAADTGAGKSSLAINFLNDLNDDYPVLYFNLEMDGLTILQRLVAIRTGLTLDQIEGYQKDENTAAAVNGALRAITARKRLQVIQNVYALEGIEDTIKQTTAGREEPTIVIIDHSLLVTTNARVNGRYERFTHISEELRRISRQQNIIMFVLLQQSREGKKDENEPPKNYSLKESGSWENDATHICFLWYDPAVRKKKLLITKNRHGEQGEFVLQYYKHTQTYREATQATVTKSPVVDFPEQKKTPRDKKREKLNEAYMQAMAGHEGKPSYHDIAEAAGVSVQTVRGWIREFGGATVNGQRIDPAGIDDAVELDGFVRLSVNEEEDARNALEPKSKTVMRY